MSSNSDLTKVGIITAILVTYGAVFFSLVKVVDFPPFPELGISLSVFGVLLTIGIFVIQWRISSKQDRVLESVSEVLKKQQVFEARQTVEVALDIRQWLDFITDGIKEIEEHVLEWKKYTNPSIRNMQRITIDSYHKHVLLEIDYLQTPDFLSSSNLSQTLKQQLKRLKTSYQDGPIFFNAQNMVDLRNVTRIKSLIVDIRGLLDTDLNN